MNERIHQLAEVANIRFGRMAILDGNPRGMARFVSYSEFEKFAELIIHECIVCCERVISDPVPKSVDTWLNGGLQCINEIKEHFGTKNE